MLSRLFFFLLVIIIVNKSFSQTRDTIDKYIEKAMAENHIPGAAVAVIKNGKIIKEGCYGFANLEDSTPVTNQSVFEIAEMSDQFTCAAILLLQQDGKISVNDLASTYLDSLPPAWQNITLKQLMNHTSGLRNDWEENTGYFLENYTDEKMFVAQKKSPLRFHPGESFYFSSGTFDLGLIIKKVTGLTYAQFLEKRIFKPLGMTSTSVYDNTRIVPHRASGYDWKDTVLQNGNVLSPAAKARGDAGVITSITDMIKWDVALKDDRLLSAESRKEMFTSGTLSDSTYIGYGYGWIIGPHSGHLTIGHKGYFRTGFHSAILLFPDIELDVIYLCNQWNISSGILSPFKIASLADARVKLVSSLLPKKDPDSKRTQALSAIIRDELNSTDAEASPRKKYFIGFMLQLIRIGALNGFTNLSYIDSMDLKNNPINVYGQKITKIIFYKTNIIANANHYLSAYFNDKNELIYVFPDDDR
jgi:CubicO group peptidase (beta-lactamase class C family)